MKSLIPDHTAVKPAVIAFDWGGTLMWNDPQATGPMMTWPQVAAVPGVQVALEALSKKYQLVVATNAADSTEEQIKVALARVGLDAYFSEIFTTRRTGHRKPETAYFRAICKEMNRSPQEMIMVGDDVEYDAAAAVTAGWQAIWYNPAFNAAPDHMPVHAQEVYNMDDLPAALERMAGIPSLALSRQWLAANGATPRLYSHVYGVAATAYQMAIWMNANGHAVDSILTHRGGLLHDLARPVKDDGRSHADIAAEQLSQQGLSRLANIADRHMLFRPLEGNPPASNEESLVYFCDKLVEMNQIVPVSKRLEALSNRYHLDPVRLLQIQEYLNNLQADLCQKAGIHPARLVEELKNSLGVEEPA